MRLGENDLDIVGSLDLSLLSGFVAHAVGSDWTLRIVDANGTVIADRDMRNVQERTNIRNAQAKRRCRDAAHSPRGRQPSRGLFAQTGRLRLERDSLLRPGAYFATINRIRSSASAFAILAFAILGAIALLMGRRILDDLSLMRSGVRAIRDRRYGEFSLEPSFMEFRELIADARSMESAVEEREAQLTDMVRQRDILLREVHHRVKNNMQIVSSLLSLQKDAMLEPEAAIALSESSSRIHALALVHEFLYHGGDFSRINLGDYFRELCSGLISAYNAQGVELLYAGDSIELEFDRAIPMGLVLNEIITNSLKYAFGERSDGKISLTINSGEREIIFSVADDGPGFLPDEVKRSLGFQLIDSLIAQLGGSLTRDLKNGTAYRIVLPREPR